MEKQQENSFVAMSQPNHSHFLRRQVLTAVFLVYSLNCVADWMLGLRSLRFLTPTSVFGIFYFVLAFLSHYALLQALILTPIIIIAAWRPSLRFLHWALPPVLGVAQFILYLDRIIFDLYRFHFNWAVIDFLTTPGVGDSLQLSTYQYFKAVGLILILIATEYCAVRLAWSLMQPRFGLLHRFRTVAIVTAAILGLAAATEKTLYAIADIKLWNDVCNNTGLLPFYLATTCRSFAEKLGFKTESEYHFDQTLALRYPLVQPQLPETPPPMNIIWIAVECWRHDAFNAEITPKAYQFAQRCLTSDHHYSSGNTTRYAIFGMFYGLHGFYWKPFLTEQRGPVFIDLLRDLGYQFRAMGSASFDNPEFRQTCFAKLSASEIKNDFDGLSPEQDYEMTQEFSRFLDERSQTAPFFCFMFMDAPHSHLYKSLPGFNPPYPAAANGFVSYENLAGNKREQQQTHMRYLNSIAYVDFLLGGVLAEIEKRGLLENSIIMIAGDHGEEFGESGFYGHNSAFNDWQTRTPFIFYYPGVTPGTLPALTSHLDWVPTVLALLGFQTPPEDYCQGLNLLAGIGHEFVVSSSWNNSAIIMPAGRIVFPLNAYRLSMLQTYDELGKPLADRRSFLTLISPKLQEVLKASRSFKR